MTAAAIDLSKLPPEVRANIAVQAPPKLSNTAFLAAIFADAETPETLWTCHFAGSPATDAAWGGAPLTPGEAAPESMSSNTYFSVASLVPDASGEVRRRLSNFGRLFALVLDDAGSVQGIEPTWILETSKPNGRSNRQVGYRLSEPVGDVDLARRVHQALAAAGHIPSDKSGNNPVRYVRLPVGSNTKHNPPHAHRLLSWHPERAYPVETLIQALRLELDPPPRKEQREPPSEDLSGRSFFAKVNTKALARPEAWVPELFPSAKPYQGGYRVASKDLGRGLEEDISVHPSGIRDFGTEEPKTAIDLVMDWGAPTTALEAARWLCDRLGIDPASLGMGAKSERKERAEAPGSEPEAWAEPEPLRAPLATPEPYPVEALGDVLGSAVWALHETVKAPVALCAQSVLAAASFAAQAHFDAAMPWGEIKPVSLAMLTVGESGERKSGIDDLVLGAAKAQERGEMTAYADKVLDYEAKLATWKRASEAANKRASAKGKGKKEDFREASEEVGPQPQPPIMPLRFVTDPTVEGLYKLLAISQPSVALFSDEGGLLIGGHALNSDNALKTLARWCKLWDGSPYDRVRGGDGSGVLYGRRMALHQLAQPDVMTTLLSDRMANGQGFLARCLVAWPESTIGTRVIERYEWGGDRADVKRLFAKLKTLFEATPRTKDKREQELDPRPLALAVDAEPLAVAASNRFEALMCKGMPLCEIRDRASKAMDNAMRIAVTLTAIDRGLAAHEISRETFERALILVQWYLAEALRIRGAVAVGQSVVDAENLLDWLKSRGLRLFRSRQVLNAGPAQLRNKARFAAAVAELATNGYVIENKPGTVVEGVKTRLSWMVNPDVL